jgi:hypothetical protein
MMLNPGGLSYVVYFVKTKLCSIFEVTARNDSYGIFTILILFT